MNKSNEKSDLLRVEGNKLFYQKSYYGAMVKYNCSLCLAEPNSEMLGLAYANRSAIYFEMKLFDNCLRNVTAAKQNNYPETKAEILNNREAKCLSAMRPSNRVNVNSTDNQLVFKLSHPAHKKVPFVVDCLQVKYSEKYGRHIVTNKCLKVGDVVAIEEPFCKILQNEFLHQMCSWCFNSNAMDLMPCLTCTKAMFCSVECEANANQSFHKYECLVNEFTSTLSANLQMALRTLFTTLSMFGDSFDDLRKYLSENPYPCTVFDIDNSNEAERAKFLAINSLVANDMIMMKKSIFEQIFQIQPKLHEMWSTHIVDFLQRQIQIATLNYHEVHCWPLKKGRSTNNQDTVDASKVNSSLAYQRGTVAVGSGSYPFCSLLNHHCAPNIGRAFIQDKIVLVVQRPIKPGDQLFDNYGYHFANVSKDRRQAKLLKQYRFICDCDACANNWPLMMDLKIADKIGFNRAKKICRELSFTDLNRKKALSKYKELCEMIEKTQKNFPSLEMCSLMQSSTAYLEMSLKPTVQFD